MNIPNETRGLINVQIIENSSNNLRLKIVSIRIPANNTAYPVTLRRFGHNMFKLLQKGLHLGGKGVYTVIHVNKSEKYRRV